MFSLLSREMPLKAVKCFQLIAIKVPGCVRKRLLHLIFRECSFSFIPFIEEGFKSIIYPLNLSILVLPRHRDFLSLVSSN